MSSNARRTWSIGIIIAPVSDNKRGIIRGICDYVLLRPQWNVFKRGAVPYLPWAELDGWTGDGIIALVETPEELEQLAQLAIPVVNAGAYVSVDERIPTVHSDNRAIGRLAAEHLIEQGLRRFAYVGHFDWYHNRERLEGFKRCVEAAGRPCQVIDAVFEPRRAAAPWTLNVNATGLKNEIRQLMTPVGIGVAHDEFAYEVVNACQRLQLTVPFDVSVVGVNNDRLVCETTDPPTSSVSQSSERTGQEAARLLDRLMVGDSPPTAPVLVPPGPLIVRRSSDFLAVDDAVVVEALQFIRRQYDRPITVADIAERTDVSRRTLDKRFRNTVGRLPAEELRLTRIKRAKELLAETDMQVVMVGLHCGFQSTSGFVRAFREATGATPRRYRSSVR